MWRVGRTTWPRATTLCVPWWEIRRVDSLGPLRALRAGGVDAELHVWEAADHGGFLGMAPEDADRFRVLGSLRATTGPGLTQAAKPWPPAKRPEGLQSGCCDNGLLFNSGIGWPVAPRERQSGEPPEAQKSVRRRA